MADIQSRTGTYPAAFKGLTTDTYVAIGVLSVSVTVSRFLLSECCLIRRSAL